MELTKGDHVLMWDKRHEGPRKHENFDNLWLTTFLFEKIVGLVSNTFHISNLEGKPIIYLVNNRYLKPFLSL